MILKKREACQQPRPPDTSYFTPYLTSINENHHVIEYDQWGQKISAKGFPDGYNQPGVEERYEYDIAGNVIAFCDPNGSQSQYKYDELNRLTKVIDPLGQETDYDYDRLGGLNKTTQYQGYDDYTTAKEYDERGLLISKTEPEGQTSTYQYNACGLPETVTDPNDKITTMEYDNNRLQEMASGPDSLTYYYHPLGGVERTAVYNTQNGAGEPLDYQYYSTGLIIQRKIGNYAVDFQYDDAGNRTQITDPFNQAVSYQYDSLNRVDTITTDNKEFSYEYYADGMINAVNYPNGLRSEYIYDNMNRLIGLTNKLGANTLSTFNYAYDGNSNITSVTTGGQTTTYQYDPLNRLTGIKRPSGEEINYLYDSRGNRVKGSVTTIDTGNFKAGEFAYNSWDELASFTSGQNTTTYEYDPEGLRTEKDTSVSTTRYFCDDNGLVIAESDGTGQVTAQNIWGHKALARKIGSNYYYYIYNGHGDVIQVIDEVGNSVNSYSYDEWGNILSSQEQISNPMKYAGEYYDDETGLYYLRARYYDPSIGRFISKDSYEGDIANPMNINSYNYAYHNPCIYADPTGCYSIILSDKISNTEGGIVKWDEPSRTATFSLNGITKEFNLNDLDSTVTINSDGHIVMDSRSYQNIWGTGSQFSVNTSTAFGADLSTNGQEEWITSGDNDNYSLAPFGIAVTAIAADDVTVVGIADDWVLPVLGVAAGLTYFAKQSGKDKANDVPSWAKGNRPNPGENGNDFARRLCDEKFGPGNYSKGPTSDFNKIRKWGDRGFKK